MSNCDIIIAGGGMVGMSMALAAAKLGLQVTVIEKGSMPSQLDANFDGRVSAVAQGSSRILAHIGAWEYMAEHAEPILDIRVSDGDSPFHVHYDHHDIGNDPFGYIVQNRHIRNGLQQAAQNLTNLKIIEGTAITACELSPAQAQVILSDGEALRAKLLLATDGKFSPLRKMVGIDAIEKSYGQTAIVCTIKHEKPHQGLAQERFLAAGPFAVLPMQDNRSSLVWVERDDRVSIYTELDNKECEQEISERVGDYLGVISIEGKRFTYPLTLTHAKTYIHTRFALLGDAAHGIHPIAGQGVNLGFRDVAVMEELLRKQLDSGLDIGASDLLAHYERWRRFDNMTMLGVTDGLNKLFDFNQLPIKLARGLGMWAVNQLPPLKKFFMRHTMGMVGDLPEILKKSA